jgi:hypothetical protein
MACIVLAPPAVLEPFMSSTRSALAVVCLGLASVLPAQAAYTVFYDEASYLSAVGATRGYTDFAGSPGLVVAGDSFLPGVVFGSCTAPDSVACTDTVLHNSDGITDIANGTAANGVGSLAWRFELVDVQAFAFHFVSGAIESLNFVDRITLALENVGTPGATGFIGIVSTEAIFGAIAVNGSFPGIGLDRYFLDDFRINEAAGTVPVPATAALVALGLLAAAGLSRRKA